MADSKLDDGKVDSLTVDPCSRERPDGLPTSTAATQSLRTECDAVMHEPVQKQRGKLSLGRWVKDGEKREGADSQIVVHFAGKSSISEAALAAGDERRDRGNHSTRPVLRPREHSEKLRLRLTEAELQGLENLAARTAINRCRLARKALRELIDRQRVRSGSYPPDSAAGCHRPAANLHQRPLAGAGIFSFRCRTFELIGLDMNAAYIRLRYAAK